MTRKLLLHLTGERLCCWLWERGSLGTGPCFDHTPHGLAQFAGWLDGREDVPALMLADLVEEDFQRLLLPHVAGRAGLAMRDRRLAQTWRDTALRCAHLQGREDEGRRDDIVLFSALTNPAVLAPWLDTLESQRMPLAALYTPALLSGALLPEEARREPHLLLVTQHSSGIRQTYFQHGKVRFSRLAQAAASAEQEAERTRQFLVGAHLLTRDLPLQVLALLPLARIASPAAAANIAPLLDWRVMPLEEAAARQRLAASDNPDQLFLGLAARTAPASHYPLGARQRYYSLWRARKSLYASSAVIAACCLLWAGSNIVGFSLARSHTGQLRQETHGYSAEYKSSMSSMPPAVDKTSNMKAAVQIAQMVARQGPWPQTVLSILSEALERSPQIRLTQLDWRANAPGAVPVAASTAFPGAAPTPALVAPQSSMLIGIPKAPPQQMRLQAEVLVEQDDYRSVLLSMNRFAQELARTPGMVVEIEQLPFDIRPNVKLSGKAGSPAGLGERSKFTLNLRWTP
ncbi:hypothetical protein SAMN05518865_11540 [Duganella sp. CF458]|uniref:hypothetical protein n=1 Tax=Duganella sp. CF458 TaxID=1884368 RepID=UPI0008F07C62|nr:hypothetical protein [Duganella sp. CF458]SFG63817.1 hypothetical protein SAMN05518865_11540 [Duganella sp. CF458]